jgi:hypothetical protein
MITLSRILPITDALMHVDFLSQDYFVNPPAVLVTVMEGVTEVTVILNMENVPNLGNVYTGVDLLFPVGYVGKRFSLLVHGE